MPSIASHISSHNINTLHKFCSTGEAQQTCNCNNPESCPLNGECLTRASVYKGNIRVPSEEMPRRYLGVAEPEFKGRWQDHMTSCNYIKYKNKTKLSQEFWKLKEQGHELDRYRDISFELVKKSVPYKAGGRKCNLCLWEKLLILQNEENVINKRDEFVSKCRHAPKFLLGKLKDRGRTEGNIT